ncbi:kinesin-like protein Klp68D [Chrysoperla carnea]|nr:kinesin-like protein Klp68D [Chrysoperla carnea]
MENIKDVNTENVVSHKASAKKKRHNSLNEAVQVVVRCRPMSIKEKLNDNFNVVVMYPVHGIVEITNPKEVDTYSDQKTFTFDVVYDANSTQDDVYNTSIRPLVESVLEGFNGCVFAYGQTGTGKTYTMEGSKENKGIIPKTFGQIWDYINRTSNMQFLVSVSYLEIYLEEIKDLLKRDHTSKLEIREYCGRGIVIPNLHTVTCKTAEEMAQVMAIGNRNRTIGGTKMNDRSSRSHAIFSVTIEMCNTDQEYENVRVGKLNLIDLAGSERQSKTGACSDRLKEASKINRALSALGNVISALAEHSSHIPYRDSKLTRLLQNSLGGNSKTVMIANIGPSNYNYEESLTTLRYAHRAKAIKNTPFKNEDPKDAKLREYRDEIKRLKELIEQRRLEEKQVIVIHKVIKVHRNSARSEDHITNSDSYETDRSSDSGSEADLEDEIDDEEDTELMERLYLERQKTDELAMRLEELESQLVKGGHALEVIDINEQKLAEQLLKIEEQKTRETEMQYVLEQESDTKVELHEAYSSLQQEFDSKSQKINEMAAIIKDLQEQILDLREKTNEEQREIEVLTEALNKELKLKTLIIENFISDEARCETTNKIHFDTNTDSWVLKRGMFERRTCRPSVRPEYDRPITNYALSKMKTSSCPYRYKSENIINLSLDLPEKTTVKYQPSNVPSTYRHILNVAMCQEDDVINIGDGVHGVDCPLGTDSARTQAQMDTIARNLAMKKETQRALQMRSAKTVPFVIPACTTPSFAYNKYSKK